MNFEAFFAGCGLGIVIVFLQLIFPQIFLRIFLRIPPDPPLGLEDLRFPRHFRRATSCLKSPFIEPVLADQMTFAQMAVELGCTVKEVEEFGTEFFDQAFAIRKRSVT